MKVRTSRLSVPRVPAGLLAGVAFLAAVLASPGAAGAQARTHDGFFLQMDLGGGALVSQGDIGVNEVKFSGGAAQFSIGIGGAVVENLILAGQLWGASVVDPKMEFNGRRQGSADATLSLSGIGLNLTWYLMPANVYFSITPSLTTLSLENRNVRGETETGFGLRVAVGKEWWVSDNWGLGLNGQFAFSSNEDAGETLNSSWFGVAFSATFN